MRFPKHIVNTSMGLYTDGLSLKKARRRVKKIYEILIKSNQTILNWLDKFGKVPKKVLKGLADRLHADETKLKTYKKGLFFWLWILICKGVSPVGWHLSEHRTSRDARLLFWEARRRFPPDYWPEIVRTDKCPVYDFATHKVFGYEVKHEKMKSFKHGNNVAENFFRCKSRFPRFRTIEGAKRFINHWLWENFEDDSFLTILYHTFIGYNRKTISQKLFMLN